MSSRAGARRAKRDLSGSHNPRLEDLSQAAPAWRAAHRWCGVIVAVIYNGLGLLGLGASSQNIWTAAVLLAAVAIDTVARRSSRTNA